MSSDSFHIVRSRSGLHPAFVEASLENVVGQRTLEYLNYVAAAFVKASQHYGRRGRSCAALPAHQRAE